jgi:hypothetical protein
MLLMTMQKSHLKDHRPRIEIGDAPNRLFVRQLLGVRIDDGDAEAAAVVALCEQLDGSSELIDQCA